MQSLDLAYYASHIVTERSLVVALSSSGETTRTVEAVLVAQHHRALTVALTNTTDSTLAQECERTLFVDATRVGWPTQSSTAALALVLRLAGLLGGALGPARRARRDARADGPDARSERAVRPGDRRARGRQPDVPVLRRRAQLGLGDRGRGEGEGVHARPRARDPGRGVPPLQLAEGRRAARPAGAVRRERRPGAGHGGGGDSGSAGRPTSRRPRGSARSLPTRTRCYSFPPCRSRSARCSPSCLRSGSGTSWRRRSSPRRRRTSLGSRSDTLLCIGNLTADEAIQPDGSRSLEWAGDALYTALAARAHLDRVTWLAPIGADFPQELLDDLERAGVVAADPRRRDLPTVRNVVTYREDGTRRWELVHGEDHFDAMSVHGEDVAPTLLGADGVLVSAMSLRAQSTLVPWLRRSTAATIYLDLQEDFLAGNEETWLSVIGCCDVFMPSEVEAVALAGTADLAPRDRDVPRARAADRRDQARRARLARARRGQRRRGRGARRARDADRQHRCGRRVLRRVRGRPRRGRRRRAGGARGIGGGARRDRGARHPRVARRCAAQSARFESDEPDHDRQPEHDGRDDRVRRRRGACDRRGRRPRSSAARRAAA